MTEHVGELTLLIGYAIGITVLILVIVWPRQR